MEKLTVFWFRRDLRLDDNKGLYKALTSGNKVIPIFIFDTEITSKLERNDARLNFIYNALGGINNTMRGNRCSLGLYRGTPKVVIKKIIENFEIEKVIVNHDYEPYAKNRDEEIKAFLKEKGIAFESYKDQVIFEKNEITKDDGNPYVVYTPYSRKWLAKYEEEGIEHFPSEQYLDNFYK